MIFIIAISLALLVGLILLRVNAFIAFILAALAAGLLSGLEPVIIIQSIEKGLGNSLGSLVIILGFGAVIGKIMAENGATHAIASAIIKATGYKYLPLAMMAIGILVGIPMFFSVAFVILVPILFSVAKNSGQSPLYLGLPMIAALSATHGLLPPHPAPIAVINSFGAAMDKTILFGGIVALPAIILAGPVFARNIKNIQSVPLKIFDRPAPTDDSLPSLFASLFCALLPLVLLALPALVPASSDGVFSNTIQFISQPIIAMLIAVFAAMFILGMNRGKPLRKMMEQFEQAFSEVAMILLIIAGAGAFSEVCSRIGLDEYISHAIIDKPISPIFLCWAIAAGIRLAVGSATVAATTTAGMLAVPLASSGVSPELLVLSTCAGSLIFSHVNDGGFWLFKEYFNLSVKQTIQTWSVLETIIAVAGLAGCFLLNMFI